MLKRIFDISLSGLGLIISSPLWATIAIAIKIEDGGPVFYGQPRVGKGGKDFQSVKFRSMVPDSDAKWGVLPATAKGSTDHGCGPNPARHRDGRATPALEYLSR